MTGAELSRFRNARLTRATERLVLAAGRQGRAMTLAGALRRGVLTMEGGREVAVIEEMEIQADLAWWWTEAWKQAVHVNAWTE